jgi:hypothetical protein
LVQSARVEPTQFACKKAQFSRGGISSQINHKLTIVRRLLLHEENRFLRAQAMKRQLPALDGREGCDNTAFVIMVP